MTVALRKQEILVGICLDIAVEQRRRSHELRQSDPAGAALLETVADAYELRAAALNAAIIQPISEAA